MRLMRGLGTKGGSDNRFGRSIKHEVENWYLFHSHARVHARKRILFFIPWPTIISFGHALLSNPGNPL
jgi:hypothetical protein